MTPPSQIAHYKLTLKLGEGGMGAVYRATDTKLGRDVAIKILPASFAADPDRLARFSREAQVLAALNHPNIAAIYGIEQSAIVMELVDGEDLKGPVPVETAIAYARQIAIALEAAHEKGIVHRDLKPANIKVTPEGVVKLLDFGLAKAAEERASATAASPTMSPTLSLAMTQAGMILGTAAYMSPEQARGKPVDKRADIWAFGVVLFELLTGRHLYGGGETITDTLAAVVLTEPDFTALPKDTPPRIRRLLERCLRKDPKLRLRDIGEARLLIDEPEPPASSAIAGPQTRSPILPWALAALLAVALAAVVLWRGSAPATPPSQLLRLSVALPPDTSIDRYNTGPLALSADGARIAVALRDSTGKAQIYTRSLREPSLVPVAGTESGAGPFFSPDGRWLGFIDLAATKLKKVAIEGGAALAICDAPSARGASWGDDDNIVVAANSAEGLMRVSSAGGTLQPLTTMKAGERTQRWPQVLPQSRAVIFTSHVVNSDYDHANIDIVVAKTGERRTLLRDGFAARYIESGHLLYLHQSTLFAVPFDLAKLQVTGAPVPVLNKVVNSGTAGALYTVSRNGLMLDLEGSDSRTNGLSAVDEAGGTSMLHDSTSVIGPRFSPDGARVAFSPNGPGGADLLVKDLARAQASRLTFLPGFNSWPVWTPDSKVIVFLNAISRSDAKLYWIRSDGAGGPQLLSDLPQISPYSISPDGKRLAFSQLIGNQGEDLFTAPIAGLPDHPVLGKPELFLATPAVEVQPAFSPDGRWIAYTSNESGTFEIYVRPFPGPGGRWQISTHGGNSPAWSRKTHELVYATLARSVIRVEYTASGDSFVPGQSRQWPLVELADVGTNVAFDLSPDGKRLAAILPPGAGTGKPQLGDLNILVNFFDEVKRRLPSPR